MVGWEDWTQHNLEFLMKNHDLLDLHRLVEMDEEVLRRVIAKASILDIVRLYNQMDIEIPVRPVSLEEREEARNKVLDAIGAKMKNPLSGADVLSMISSMNLAEKRKALLAGIEKKTDEELEKQNLPYLRNRVLVPILERRNALNEEILAEHRQRMAEAELMSLLEIDENLIEGEMAPDTDGLMERYLLHAAAFAAYCLPQIMVDQFLRAAHDIHKWSAFRGLSITMLKQAKDFLVSLNNLNLDVFEDDQKEAASAVLKDLKDEATHKVNFIQKMLNGVNDVARLVFQIPRFHNTDWKNKFSASADDFSEVSAALRGSTQSHIMCGGTNHLKYLTQADFVRMVEEHVEATKKAEAQHMKQAEREKLVEQMVEILNKVFTSQGDAEKIAKRQARKNSEMSDARAILKGWVLNKCWDHFNQSNEEEKFNFDIKVIDLGVEVGLTLQQLMDHCIDKQREIQDRSAALASPMHGVMRKVKAKDNGGGNGGGRKGGGRKGNGNSTDKKEGGAGKPSKADRKAAARAASGS